MNPHNLIWARVRTTFLRQIYRSIHPSIQPGDNKRGFTMGVLCGAHSSLLISHLQIILVISHKGRSRVQNVLNKDSRRSASFM